MTGAAGFVFDMIQRNKANRALLEKRRKRREKLCENSHSTHSTPSGDKITAERFCQIQKHIRERKRDERRYVNRMMLLTTLFLLIVVGAGIVLAIKYIKV